MQLDLARKLEHRGLSAAAASAACEALQAHAARLSASLAALAAAPSAAFGGAAVSVTQAGGSHAGGGRRLTLSVEAAATAEEGGGGGVAGGVAGGAARVVIGEAQLRKLWALYRAALYRARAQARPAPRKKRKRAAAAAGAAGAAAAVPRAAAPSSAPIPQSPSAEQDGLHSADTQTTPGLAQRPQPLRGSSTYASDDGASPGAGGGGEPSAPADGEPQSAQQPAVAVSLANAAFDTGRPAAPESTLGGDTTCIVCFTNPKTHIAAPCGHLSACGACSAKMEQCPYCREPVMLWMQLRMT